MRYPCFQAFLNGFNRALYDDLKWMRYPFQALKRMREYDKKIAEGEAKARALTQQRELRDQLLGRDAEPTSSSAVDQGSESSFSSMSVGIKLWIKGDCVQGNASTAYDIGKIKILIEEKFVCVGG